MSESSAEPNAVIVRPVKSSDIHSWRVLRNEPMFALVAEKNNSLVGFVHG